MTIAAFGGRIAAGKSSVSKGVASRLGAPWVSFGDAVRAEACSRGLPLDRAILQELGDRFIAEGWDAFIDRVIGQARWDGQGLLVVDGVRHTAAIRAFERRYGETPILVVFVDATWDRRAQRLTERAGSRDGLRAADAHANEAGVDDVRKRADVVVHNEASLDDAVSAALEALEVFGVPFHRTQSDGRSPDKEKDK
jgi:dephospho-CoA kinase